MAVDAGERGQQDQGAAPFPFNNLFLLSGLVTGYNRLWMYVFTVSLLMLGYVSFQFVWLYPMLERLFSRGYSQQDVVDNTELVYDFHALGVDRNLVFGLELGMFVFGFIGLFAGLRFVHRKTLQSVLTGWQRFRYGHFFFAFSVWGAMILIGFFIEMLLEPGELVFSFQPAGFAVSLLLTLLLMPVQTGLEEVVFRGYLLQGFALITRNGIVPLLVTSLLFAAAHMTNPEVEAYGTGIMFTYYLVFAMYMCAITLLSEGTELALGIHLANNMISSILITSPHSVIKTYSLFETRSVDPYGEIIIWGIMALIAFCLFYRRYRWNNFSLIIR
jgi:membrane protease YdiL (CAAX protease family)